MRQLLVVLSILALAVAGCGGGNDDASGSETGGQTGATGQSGNTKVVEKQGYSFEHPASVEPGPGEFLEETEGELDRTLLFAGDYDVVAVIVYSLPVEITEANFEEYKDAYDAEYDKLVKSADGTTETGPEDVEIDGLPGIQYTGTTATPDGPRAQTRTTIFFDGDRQYYVECQWTQGGEQKIGSACDAVLESFDVEG